MASAKAQVETRARRARAHAAALRRRTSPASADLDTAQGQLRRARARSTTPRVANVDAQQAAIGAQNAQLKQSTANLGYTKIYSPVDGVVVTRGIDPGATVVASFQAPVLFVIAQDLRKMRVLADVDEADVGKIAEGMEADCVVDAFPGEVFHGMVSQIRYSPNNVSGVVTYSAVVEVDNPEEKLRPGMTATITVQDARGARRACASRTRRSATSRRRPTGPTASRSRSRPRRRSRRGRGASGVLTNDKPGDEKDEMHVVSIGITDGIFTEVTDPTLARRARRSSPTRTTTDRTRRRRA